MGVRVKQAEERERERHRREERGDCREMDSQRTAEDTLSSAVRMWICLTSSCSARAAALRLMELIMWLYNSGRVPTHMLWYSKYSSHSTFMAYS